MNLNFQTRYPFRHILWILGLIVLAYSLVADKNLTPETNPAEPLSLGFKLLWYGLRFLYHVVFLYFGLNLFYHLITRRRAWTAYIKISLQIILSSLAYHTFLYLNYPELLLKKYDSLPDMLCTCMQNMIPMLIFCFAVAYLTNIREALVQRRILQEKTLKLEKEMALANFNFLKSQINPHFLQNTLSFLYAKSIPYSAELSEGILTLSDIMRYALNEATQPNGKALLSDEVEHVNNLIKINQMRFENRLQVRFDIQGSLNGVRIVPFVLITLVENALKHGDLNDPDQPLQLLLRISGKKLYFSCKNKKKTGPKQLSTGIGLENIRKRLELTYGDHCRFVVDDEPDMYHAELSIEPY